MKLSTLLKRMFKASEFTSVNSLAKYTGQTQPFVAGLLADERKESMEKMDEVFQALTENVSEEEFLAALELVSKVRQQMIEKEQLL